MTDAQFLQRLADIVKPAQLLTDAASTERFRQGWRSGGGEAEAVVQPTTLLELWKILKACSKANRIVIMQAANTGLTEGSTPNGSYDRPVVIISTLKLDKIHVLNDGKEIISHAGGTLYELESRLKPYGRQPHSVIGSSCIGASVMGGVCNNSGGSLVQRGPAYTELALYAQRQADGSLVLVNHLGVDLGNTPEEILGRLDRGDFTDANLQSTQRRGSDDRYVHKVRDVEASTPARYNADAERLHEASGCAGKLAIFAVRLDTFPLDDSAQVLYLGTNNTNELTEVRRRMLTELPRLPISGEYMHREIFDLSHRYGKDTVLMIHWLGTRFLPFFFALKGRLDARFRKWRWVPSNLTDRLMQSLSRLVPEALPRRMLEFRDRYAHHLIIKLEAAMVPAAQTILNETVGEDGWFLCTDKEAGKAMLNRFAAAGAPLRYQVLNSHEVEDVIALDIALRRNDTDWFETLPEYISTQLVSKLYYGHFFCHVFHQDYLVKKGADIKQIKHDMLALLDARGAEYPAEHNVGHLYEAKPELANFYESLDPTNSFNPGIGQTSRQQRPLVSEVQGVRAGSVPQTTTETS